jgi:hypothetical protein
MMLRVGVLVSLSVLALSPAPAMAWDSEGHAVVALVAEHYLDPAVKQRVDSMLAADPDPLTGKGIADAANWADRYRDSDKATTKLRFNATRQWHWIDLEIDHPDLDAACFHRHGKPFTPPASAGPADDCVVDKIEAFTAELSDPSTPPGERLLALKYLLHFIGDLHQPLHASDNHDQGGSKVKVTEAGSAPATLHHDWNEGFLDYLGDDPKAIADDLADAMRQSKSLAAMQAGTPVDWAFESYGLARDRAYGKLPPPGPDGVYALPPAYATGAIETIRLQLARAGVRLAATLNKALAGR